jgi:hypothetical protein
MKRKSFVLLAVFVGVGIGLAAGPGWAQESPGPVKTVASWQWVLAADLAAGIEANAGPAQWKQVLILEKSFSAVKDNTLFEDPNGGLSDGAGPKIFVGHTRQRRGAIGAIRRGLIYFDLSNSGIPGNAPITKVTLQLHVSDSATGPQTIALHRVLKDWGEGISFSNGTGGIATPGDATWLHTFYNTSFWTTPGGDFSPVVSASAVVAGEETFPLWSARQMIVDVYDWLNSPSENFGWLLQGNESTLGTAKGFHSREEGTPEFQPLLTIEYQPVLQSYFIPAVFK